MKKLITSLAIMSATVGGYYAGDKEVLSVERQYIIMPSKKLAQRVSFIGANGVKNIPNTTSFKIKATTKRIENLKESLGNDFEVYEEKTYRTSIVGCTPKPKAPVPTPEPTPEPDETIGFGVKLMKADDAMKLQDTRTVKVCVIDTGIDSDHPDIKYHRSASFVNNEPLIDDLNGHGTHVAGIIGATAGNQKGIHGVANVELYIVKGLDRNGIGGSSALASSVYECGDFGADIVNMSWGSPKELGPDPLIERAINDVHDKGVIFVAAAGNGGMSSGSDYPAGLSNVISVAAVDDRLQLASFSNTGDVDYAASGVNVLSLGPNGGYRYSSGTSMASPYIAGALAYEVASGKRLKTKTLGLGRENEGEGVPDLVETLK